MNAKPCLLALLSVLFALPSPAKPPADLQQKLDRWAKGEAGGVAAAWVDPDGARFFVSGTTDASDPRPVTADTVFEVGSLSKVFTAVLLAESERQGKVSRLDPAAKYLLSPDDPMQAALAKITLLSLATHRSGLPRLPQNIGPNPDAMPDPYAAYDRAKLVEALKVHGAVATVGGDPVYSNFGVAVLGEALAAAWGTTYEQALREHVLLPLGMKATGLGLAGLPESPDLAPAHAGGKRVGAWTFQAFAPMGAVRSSARDMALFVAAALRRGDTPLAPAFAATEEPQCPFAEVGGHIGLGWLMIDDPAKPLLWHNGSTAGSHAFLGLDLRNGTGLVLLANVQKAPEPLGFELLGSPGPKAADRSVPNAADYPGSYPLTPAFVITVTQVKGSLYLQATGQARLALRPKAPDRFSVVDVAAEISFERDRAGKVVALVLHQNGADQRAPRGEAPPAPKEVTLPEETLREYAGSYPLVPNFVLTIREEGGSVFARATGQQEIPIYPSARDEFFYKVVNARISFTRDAAGRVTGLVLHQNGQNLPAPKAEP